MRLTNNHHEVINGKSFHFHMRDYLNSNFANLFGEYKNPHSTWEIGYSSRSIAVGSTYIIPEDKQLFWDNPSNDPIKNKINYVSYIRRFVTSYVLFNDWSLGYAVDTTPIFLFYDFPSKKYEILTGNHRINLRKCVGSLPLSANIFYDSRYPPEINLEKPFPYIPNFEKIGEHLRFEPRIADVNDQFMSIYFENSMTFLKSLKTEPQLHFYFNDVFLFQTPSSHKDIYKIQLSPKVSIWHSIMQFIGEYYFYEEPKGERYYETS